MIAPYLEALCEVHHFILSKCTPGLCLNRGDTLKSLTLFHLEFWEKKEDAWQFWSLKPLMRVLTPVNMILLLAQ